MKINKIPDAIIVLFLTAYSYFTSYIYFMGYYNYFNLPTFLIEVTLENIMFSVFSIFIYSFSIYVIINVLTAMIPNDLNIHMVKIIKKYIFLFSYLILTFIFSSFNFDKALWSFLGVGILLMMFIDFIIPIFSQKYINGYQNKIIAAREKYKENNIGYEYKHSINSFLFKHLPSLPILIVLVTTTAIFSYSLGTINARHQETFTVINDEIIILGTYNKKFIVKKIDTEKNMLRSNFSLIAGQEHFNFSKKHIKSLAIE